MRGCARVCVRMCVCTYVCVRVCVCVYVRACGGCHRVFPLLPLSTLLRLELHALLLSDIFVLMERDVNHDRYFLRTHSQIDIKGNKDEVRIGMSFHPNIQAYELFSSKMRTFEVFTPGCVWLNVVYMYVCTAAECGGSLDYTLVVSPYLCFLVESCHSLG